LCKEQIADLRTRGLDTCERCFTVQGTMADPRYLYATLDPGDCPPNRRTLSVPEQAKQSATIIRNRSAAQR